MGIAHVLRPSWQADFLAGASDGLAGSKEFRKLDLTAIGDRLLVAGRCSHLPTDRQSHVNNVEQMAAALQAAGPAVQYSIFYFGPPEDNRCDPRAVGGQLYDFSLARSLMLPVGVLFEACRAMGALLGLDGTHRIIVQCRSGLARSGLVVACFLRLWGFFDSTYEAFDFFVERRCGPKHARADLAWASATLKRYLRYFNDIVTLGGRPHNGHPLGLHQIIVHTVPDFDGLGGCQPELEVLVDGELRYSSQVQQRARAEQEDRPLVYIDRNMIVFWLKGLGLFGDVVLRVSHCVEGLSPTTICTHSFNTGFLQAGIIRSHAADLHVPYWSVPPPGADPKRVRFQDGFCMDMVLAGGREKGPGLCYNVSGEDQLELLRILSGRHHVQADPENMSALLFLGASPVACQLALQLFDNDIHAAHEFLASKRDVPAYRGLFDRVKVPAPIEKQQSSLEPEPVPEPVPCADTMSESGRPQQESFSDSQTVFSSSACLSSSASLSNAAPLSNQAPSSQALLSNQAPSSQALLSNQAPSSQAPLSSAPPPPPPPPPPPLGSRTTIVQKEGIPPPPPPPPPSLSQPASLDSADGGRLKVKTGLHWREIRDKGALSSTVWAELHGLEADTTAMDIVKFEELFCIDPKKEKRRLQAIGTGGIESDKTSQTSVSPTFIDIRRANNIGIGLSRFSKRCPTEKLGDLIAEASTALTLDDLLALRNMLPSAEERAALKLYQGLPEGLILAERFLLAMSQIPGLDWMIDGLVLERSLDSELGSLRSKYEGAVGLLTKLRESPALKRLLKLILELGYLTNYEYGRVPQPSRERPLGFKIDALLKLKDVWSVDRRHNLLHYLCMQSEDVQCDIQALAAEFPDLQEARHWDFAGLSGTLDGLLVQLDRLKNVRGAPRNDLVPRFRSLHEPFVERASAECALVDGLRQQFRTAWAETARYYGEGVSEQRPEEMLLIFDSFVGSLSTALAEVQSGERDRLSRASSTTSTRSRLSRT